MKMQNYKHEFFMKHMKIFDSVPNYCTRSVYIDYLGLMKVH